MTYPCRRALLTGSGFSYDSAFAHAFGEQHLPYGIVDFVRAGVVREEEGVSKLEIDIPSDFDKYLYALRLGYFSGG